MFKFKRIFFIVTNFLIANLLFLLIFHIRYVWEFWWSAGKRPLSVFTISLFLLYSLTIVILNISFKIYEVNKISRLIEAFLMNVFISLLSIGAFGIFFYLTKTDFARFVFFTGFAIIPIFLTFYNKFVFMIIVRRKRVIRILYFGSKRNHILLNSLIKEYQKWFSMNLSYVFMTEQPDNLFNKLKHCDILVVDTDQNYNKTFVSILNNYELDGGRIYSLIDIFSYFDQSLPAEIIKNSHYELFSTYKLDSVYHRYLKRIGDIVISTFILIIVFPLMLITAFLIKVTSKGGIFYSQKRVGLHGKEFNILKFRSMTASAEKEGIQLTKKNDSRMTLIGKIIRPLRIDELPQIFNIIKGDMSFIGPRPERPELIKEIIKEFPLFKKRLLVKPGLSGWAQVKYKYVNDIQKMNLKLSYDLYYINNLSMILDLKILLYTIETIIFRRGAM